MKPETGQIQTVRVGIQWTAYCGVSCRPVCQDVYGVEKIWIELDRETLIRLAKKYQSEYREFLSWIRYHANLCSAFDCVNYRLRESMEFLKKLLDREGIKYEVKSAKCEEAGNVVLDYTPLEALDIDLLT